jgi:hypothetical protein
MELHRHLLHLTRQHLSPLLYQALNTLLLQVVVGGQVTAVAVAVLVVIGLQRLVYQQELRTR